MKNYIILFMVLLSSVILIVNVQAQSSVKMNEIYSRGVAGNLDWIELYNSSSSPVNISGYKIYDIGGYEGSKPKKPFPVGTIIPAKGFYVIITDTASFTGDLSGFGLSSGGEKVWLEDTVTHTIVDTITFASMSTTQTYGRGPDGGQWTLLNSITRGSSNGSVVMNEIYSRGVAGNLDWIEIYNGVSGSVNIGGYRIYDIGGQSGSKPKKPFPSGTIIPAKGFYVIITDTVSTAGAGDDFGLGSSGEKVWLEDTTTHTIIDTVTFGAMSTTQTWGRLPDGGTWQLLNTITRGTSNAGGTSVQSGYSSVAKEFTLLQNYPNPFNPTTAISYQLLKASRVSLKIFDLLGQEVATLVNEVKPAGNYTIEWNAASLGSGAYFYRMQSGSFVSMKKMIFMK